MMEMNVEELRDEVQRLQDFIARRGYRRCDIAACNCGGFHGGDAEARLDEIYEALDGCPGTTPLREIKRLRGDL